MVVFAMPSLGADMEAGTLVEWLVKAGDPVTRGDVIAVVETQKGAIEIEVFESGVVDRLDAKLGDRLPVGAPLALIRAEGQPEAAAHRASASDPSASPAGNAGPLPPFQTGRPGAAEGASPDTPTASPASPQQAARPTAEHAEHRPGPSPGQTLASPAARLRAEELGVDLATVKGGGPGGAVVLADVERSAAPSAPPGRGIDLAAMRAAIAAAMARSKREIPHYYLSQTIDLQAATDWLEARNAERPPERRLLMGALLVKATALALGATPALNGRFEGEGFQPSEAVHAGVAVALRGGGLIAPAIRDAQTLDIDALMAAMRDLIARSRGGRLRGSELSEGTVTISSMGERGAEALTGVIYPPQVALVGFGAPVRRPWVVDGAVRPRMIVTARLAADHRVSDGRQGGRFLTEVDRRLQGPEAL
jgi:pyruvate dehydrogenase E2 component (dihydrolipoamide acetyltransferase)